MFVRGGVERPHGWALRALMDSVGPLAYAGPGMDTLAARIERAAEEHAFSGVVSVFRGASREYHEAFGYRDVAEGLPNTTDTLFGIASGTKLFTAVGIGVLIDQGRIALDATVRDILGEHLGFLGEHLGFVDERATIRQLLTHTSGIYDYLDETLVSDIERITVQIPWYELDTPSDYLPLFEGQTMQTRSGERYAYSNGGYVFLAILLERVARARYRDVIREHILRPTGMERSGFHSFDDLPPNTARGYLADRTTSNVDRLPRRGGGDGGMYTTSEELRAFWDALVGGRLLSEALTRTFLRTHHTFDEERGYGCGVYTRHDGSLYAIEGSDAGVGFASMYRPSEKRCVNVLSNVTCGDEGMVEAVQRAL